MFARSATIGRHVGHHRVATPAPSRQWKSPPAASLNLHWQGQQRQLHFLPLLGLWGAKHASAWTLYNACKAYGWPKVYRRLLEQNRSIHRGNPALLASTKGLIRLAIEAPPKFAVQLSQHAESVTQFLQSVAERAEPNLPRFLVAAIRFVVGSQKPIKILQDFVEAAAKK